MKKIIIYLTFAITIISCQKDKYYGTASLKGAVLYSNLDKNKTDTAKNVKVILSNEDSTLIQTIISNDGNYFFKNLTCGNNFTLKSSFYYQLVSGGNKVLYTATIPIQLKNKTNTINNITLNPQNSTLLKVLVTDSIHNLLISTQVCLYDNKTFLLANYPNCAGSLLSGVSNQYGEITFNVTASKVYYYSAKETIGTLILKNKLIDSSKLITPNIINLDTIILKIAP